LASVLALTVASGCTVRPLYSSATSSVAGVAGEDAGLGAIAINPVNTRYGQEVRNHLIFLFNGGAGQPGGAKYAMNLQVSSVAQSAAVIQVDDENRPTAGTLRMTGSYVVKDLATGEIVIQGKREVSSSYDQPRQQFAALRARRDAEDRSARELAEFLKLDVAQRMVTRESSAALK
jgi:LPS-assembly lipoprotein